VDLLDVVTAIQLKGHDHILDATNQPKERRDREEKQELVREVCIRKDWVTRVWSERRGRWCDEVATTKRGWLAAGDTVVMRFYDQQQRRRAGQ
jgi:hypothetical protein